MKIKLAILENDQSYLNRIVSVFNTKYSENFEIYSFTNMEIALEAIENNRINVLIADDEFDIDADKLPARCGFAYFVESAGIEQIKDQAAICKFQKVELIYKQILSIYSEKAGNVSEIKLGEDTCKIIAFTSASGGSGSSSVAASCAAHHAKKGMKTLYLNFEVLGSSDIFFSGEGQFDMSDIIFSIKSQKTNLAIKLESCVKQDASGVYFYSQPKIALDMMELNEEEIIRLISDVRIAGTYNYIILDLNFSLNNSTRKILRQAHTVVLVGDGSENSNNKMNNAYLALSMLEANEEQPLVNRISILYNKFSNKTSQVLEIDGVKSIGGAPRYEHATTSQVVAELSKMMMFDQLM